MSRTIDSNNNVVFDCKYHVVFCPKYRRKVLTAPIDARLKELLESKVKEHNSNILEMDHARPRAYSCFVRSAVRRVLRLEFKRLTSLLPSLWTNSYFVATVGSVSLETVKRYIELQKER